jgi:predicted GNAT superfamily acetyltransferase
MGNDIVIRALSTTEDIKKAEELQRIVWGSDDTNVVPDHLLLALLHNGGLVLGAFDGHTLAGLLVGFLGTDSESPSRPALARLKHHSHMLGIHPNYRDRGIGFRLKLDQRNSALENGIRLVTWTYDPLQSRNASLNIRRLGTICRTYKRNYYGEMRDEINLGVHSDRFHVEWWITSRRVTSRVEKKRRPLDLANFLGGGAVKVNPSTLRADTMPVPAESLVPLEGNLLLVEIPSDIDKMRSVDPELAHAWTEQTRDIFERAFHDGYIITDFVYLKGEKVPRSYYVLSHGESTLG